MIPDSYRENKNNCGNCKHCFIWYDYDDSDKFYCHIDKSNRPKCGSSRQGECLYAEFDIYDTEENQRAQYEVIKVLEDLWKEWAVPRQTLEGGTCDEWEGRE